MYFFSFMNDKLLITFFFQSDLLTVCKFLHMTWYECFKFENVNCLLCYLPFVRHQNFVDLIIYFVYISFDLSGTLFLCKRISTETLWKEQDSLTAWWHFCWHKSTIVFDIKRWDEKLLPSIDQLSITASSHSEWQDSAVFRFNLDRSLVHDDTQLHTHTHSYRNLDSRINPT